MADLSGMSNQDLLSALSDDDLRQIAGQPKKSFVGKVKDVAVQSGKALVGMAENAANQASTLSALAVTGIPNIIGSTGAELAESLVQERMPTFKGISDKFHRGVEAQVYQPQTESGNAQVEATGQALTAIPKAVDFVDEATGDKFKSNFPNAYAFTQTAGEFAPFVVGGKAIHGALKKPARPDIRFEVDQSKLAENRRVPVKDMPTAELEKISNTEPSKFNHDNLTAETTVPVEASAAVQKIAPEVKPVIVGTPEQMSAIDRTGKVEHVADGKTYLIDEQGAQAKYGGSVEEAVTKAKEAIDHGGAAESEALGYANREGMKDPVTAAVDTQGKVMTDPVEIAQKAEAKEVVFANEGKPAEAVAKAEEVATAIQPEGFAGTKNAFTEAERTAAGEPLRTIPETKPLEQSLSEGKALLDTGKFDLATAEAIKAKPRQLTDAEDFALKGLLAKNKTELGSIYDRISEAKKAGDTATVDALMNQRDTLETQRKTIWEASEAAGTEWGRAGRARQELINQDFTLTENIRKAKANSPTGEISEVQRAKIESLTARLEAITKEAATKDERIANLEAEAAIKEIARQEGRARRQGTRKQQATTLDTEFADLKGQLDRVLNPNKLNAGLDPEAVIIIGKMAKNRVQKGMVKAADIVDHIYTELGGAIDRREIQAAIIASNKKSIIPDKELIKLEAKEAELKRQIVAEVEPQTLAQRAHAISLEAWKAGLLSGPKTHIVNVTSNAMTLMGKPVETGVAALLDAARSKMTGTQREVFIREAAADVVGAKAGFQEGVRNAVRAWAEALPPEEAMKFNEAQQMNAIPGRTGKIVRIPFRLLGAADAFFKGVARSSEAYRLATKQALREGLDGKGLESRVNDLLANDAAIKEAAKIDADYRTFNQPVAETGRVIAAAKKIPYIGIGIDFIMPFVRTPLNIAKYGLERTPLNFVRIAEMAVKKELKGGRLSEELAKPVIGTALVGAIINMVESDMITGGGPKDKAKREAWLRAGKQPYSFKIGDKYYSYNRFEPMGMTFGTAADFATMATDPDMKESTLSHQFGALALSISRNWTSKTFMKALSSTFDVMSDPEMYGKSFINQYAGTLIPGIVNTAAQIADPMARDARTPLDTIMGRVPGQSDDLPIRHDLFGREQRKAGLTAVDRALSPMQIAQESTDMVDREMLRIGIAPGMPARKLRGNELTPEQYQEYVIAAGQKSYPIVRKILLSSNLPDYKKKEAVEDVITNVRRAAGTYILKKYGMRPIKAD